MASKGFSRSLRTLRASIASSRDPPIHCLTPISTQYSRKVRGVLTRSMATETALPSTITRDLPRNTITRSMDGAYIAPYTPPPAPSEALTVPLIIYTFPHLEPLKSLLYPTTHLYLPLRRDLLHRAVIFEGDATRQGTASSKTRYEVHGSHRKIRPQKGTGKARLGTRQSPMLRGGGKSFGPHPRDFATGLPRKVYDVAVRTALSYRYRRGELVVVDRAEVEVGGGEGVEWVREVFGRNGWGREGGRSLVVTEERREGLFAVLGRCGEVGVADVWKGVDVKDLLGLGRVIIERAALDAMLRAHRSDLAGR